MDGGLMLADQTTLVVARIRGEAGTDVVAQPVFRIALATRREGSARRNHLDRRGRSHGGTAVSSIFRWALQRSGSSFAVGDPASCSPVAVRLVTFPPIADLLGRHHGVSHEAVQGNRVRYTTI